MDPLIITNPWPVLGPALGGIFLVVLAVELVIAVVKTALTADTGAGSEV